MKRPLITALFVLGFIITCLAQKPADTTKYDFEKEQKRRFTLACKDSVTIVGTVEDFTANMGQEGTGGSLLVFNVERAPDSLKGKKILVQVREISFKKGNRYRIILSGNNPYACCGEFQWTNYSQLHKYYSIRLFDY